ncbi:DUF4062 domain-containing protein [Algoriphagus sp.]|uniref:DUF4062 domain-containing protein n=1 Tax=Algoriphagus sp. TaxID=1872435 RepID=UPI00262DAD46|nr:DUF4062 domain-containing protein [Algoriphagus sp.]
MRKTVFISSTFEDLKEHRNKVWEILNKYEVNIRGMEQFGARTEKPIETCIAEVVQSDIFVGIIACRLGSIDIPTAKSFVQREYEKAKELEKEIFIYLLDERNGKVVPAHVDKGENFEKLEAFKSILRENHTVDIFKDEIDLSEKLDRKFNELLSRKSNGLKNLTDEYANSNDTLKKFFLLPKEYSGKEVKLKVKFDGNPFPASKEVCRSFSVNYGRTIGIGIKILSPETTDQALKFLLIDSKLAESFFQVDKDNEVEIYATLNFSEGTISNLRASFISTPPSTAYSLKTSRPIGLLGDMYEEIRIQGVQAEGQLVLILKEIINSDGNKDSIIQGGKEVEVVKENKTEAKTQSI